MKNNVFCISAEVGLYCSQNTSQFNYVADPEAVDWTHGRTLYMTGIHVFLLQQKHWNWRTLAVYCAHTVWMDRCWAWGTAPTVPPRVFTARCTLVQNAVLRSHVVCLSVRPSVRPSVTLVNC